MPRTKTYLLLLAIVPLACVGQISDSPQDVLVGNPDLLANDIKSDTSWTVQQAVYLTIRSWYQTWSSHRQQEVRRRDRSGLLRVGQAARSLPVEKVRGSLLLRRT